MRKEVVYALIAGSILGIIIAFGIWRANSAFKSEQNTTSQTPSPESNSLKSGITLAKPDNLSVVSSDAVTITGIASPNSWVVISSETKDYFVKPEADGSFSVDLKLGGGINRLMAFGINSAGEVSWAALTLVVSTEFKTPTVSASPKEASGESEIRDKVIKRVQEALTNPKAEIGTVTDIAAGTLQIKTESGEIKQISAKDDLTGVKFTDIAIGDFIVAMGYSNGNEVLEAKRILISKAPAQITVVPAMGTVVKIDKKTLTLKINEEKEVFLTFPKKWQGPEINKISLNNQLIAVGKQTENDFQVRSVFIIPPQTPSPTPTSTP